MVSLGKWKKRKVRGESTYVATLVALMVLMLFVVSTIYSYSNVVKQNKVVRIERQYLLKMEKEGYLTESDKALLLQDLTDAKLTNIDLSGTSMSPVGYGNTVTLSVCGDLEVNRINFAMSSKEQGVIHIEIKKTGTALY